jgi:uncharacterized membrane protein YGL010W
MRNLAEQMSFYESHHSKKITKFTHFIGVPVIVLSLQVLLSWFHVSVLVLNHVSFAWVALILLLVYYLFLDFNLAVVSAVFLIPITLLARYISGGKFDMVSLGFFFLLFVIGWTAQLIGHYFEGKRPAFLENFFQVFVAPVFLVAEICFSLGYRKELQNKVLELSKQNKRVHKST